MELVKLNIGELQSSGEPVRPLSKIVGPSVHIELDEDAVPYHVSAPRRIPLPLMDKLERKLNHMI